MQMVFFNARTSVSSKLSNSGGLA